MAEDLAAAAAAGQVAVEEAAEEDDENWQATEMGVWVRVAPPLCPSWPCFSRVIFHVQGSDAS